MKKILAALTLSLIFYTVTTFANEGFVYSPDYSDGSANIYVYNTNLQYEIYASVGYVTDVQLRAGERVQKIATGNSTQFAVDLDEINNIQHVYIKPLAYSVRTNIVINTNLRSYRLIVVSGEAMTYLVKFAYPEEEARERQLEYQKDLAKAREMYYMEENAMALADKINKNYSCTKNKNVVQKYLPTAIFDDGQKTYIEIPAESQDNMPTIYYFDRWAKNKLQLVNYRIKGNYLEVDKVMDNVKLVYSQKAYLILKKTDEDNKIIPPRNIPLNKKTAAKIALDTLAIQDSEAKIPLEQESISIKDKLHEKQLQEQKELIKIAAAANEVAAANNEQASSEVKAGEK